MKQQFTLHTLITQHFYRLFFLVILTPFASYGQSTTVVISQVYTAGGNSGATYKNDFVELHNLSGTAQSLSGYSVQYAGASSTAIWTAVPLSGSIPAGGYYLVQGTAPSSPVGAALPPPDATGLPNMVTSGGKVALVTSTAALPAGCPSGATIVDLVGYGSGTACAENTAVTYPSSATNATLRLASGCTDTNNNSTDFSTAPVSPRNSASPVYICGVTAYYAKPTGDLSLPATFGANTDGSGQAPPDFTVAGATYTVTGTDRTFGASWVVSGTGAKVILAENASLTVPAGYSFTGTLDQLAGSTLVLKNTTTAAYSSITQGVQAASSTVNFAQTGAYTLPDAATFKLQNLRLTDGTKTLAKNIVTTDANGNLVQRASLSVPGSVVIDHATVSGAGSSPFSALELGGNLTLVNGGSFATAASTRIALVLLGTAPQTITGNGQNIVLAELDIPNSGGGGILADAGGAATLELGNSAGGGYYLETGTTLQLNTNSLRFLPGGKAYIAAASAATDGLGTVTPSPSSAIDLENNGSKLTGTLRLTPGATTLSSLRFASARDVLYLTSDLTVTGALNLEKGDLHLPDNSSLALGGAIGGVGHLHGSPGTSLTVGSGASGTLSFAAGYQALSSLTLSHAGSLTLASPLSVGSKLRLGSGVLATDATNLLTLGAGATIEGGSETSFIAGPLARTVGAVSSPVVVAFPIGKGAAYRPLALNISSQTGTTVYRAEQTEGDPGQSLNAADPSGANLQRVSRVRSFTVTPYNTAVPAAVAQPASFVGTITLSVQADDWVGNLAAPSLVVAKRPDSTQPWSNYGRSASSGTSSAGTLTSGAFSSFSDFALASTSATDNNPLPVQLVAFAATRTPAGPVALAWTTASELRSARFEVERSADGLAFERVATVAAHGTSAQPRHYAARDAALPAAGLLYYRLRLVDQDGTAAYSAVATVRAGAAAEVLLSPNPTQGPLSFCAAGSQPYLVRSVLGPVVQQGTTTEGLTQLDVAGLPPGVYVLELLTGAGPTVRRFVKE